MVKQRQLVQLLNENVERASFGGTFASMSSGIETIDIPIGTIIRYAP